MKNNKTKSTKKKTYFISDLHLSSSHPHLFSLFYDFIDAITNEAEALYILGDLFEFWIGDDIIDKPAGKPYIAVVNKLKALSDNGVKLYFMQGNRDFLAQKYFSKRIGAELLPDQKVINLQGVPTLLMHGDTLCIDDKSYQRMRALFRNKLIQKIYLSLSPARRDRIAGNTRKTVSNVTQNKPKIILDVNQSEVEKVMQKYEVTQLIHGHTHRPFEHKFKVDERTFKRIVLSDWRDEITYLSF